jgi:hypothetical protein
MLGHRHADRRTVECERRVMTANSHLERMDTALLPVAHGRQQSQLVAMLKTD